MMTSSASLIQSVYLFSSSRRTYGYVASEDMVIASAAGVAGDDSGDVIL